uniref:RNA-editing substrate-binding complex 6 protein domain-containing protein n=1 Tax=Theileria annulata TaxID=5874 RepID=A0A3B0N1R6_THEAN
MKYRDKNMLQLISARLIENIRQINSAQITSVLKAYSILNFRSDFLFRMMIPEISLKLDMMTVDQVSSIFYSYNNLGYYNKNLFQTIQSYLYSNVEKLTPYDLTLLLSGFCKNFKGFDEKFLTVLSFQFCKLLNSYDNKLFSLSVNSLSRLNFCKHKYLPSLIESEVYNRIKSSKEPLASRSLSLILNSLSKHYTSCTPLFTFLSQTVLNRLKEFDMHSVCLILSSFSRVTLSDAKTYDKIAEHVGRNSLKLYPRAIASMLYSYARANHLHGALFYFSGKHIQLNLGNYTCDEVSMALRAFSVLNVKNEELLDTFAKFILENTPDYVPIKFEDLCPQLRVSIGSKEINKFYESSENNASETQRTVLDETDDKTDLYSFEGRNINMLEYIGESSKISSNYLANGKMHSLLWIVQAYARFFFTNDNVTRALTRIANELVVRMAEMTPFLVSRILFSFSQLNFSHEAVLQMLLNEVTNPRLGFKFTQKELSLLHYSIPAFGLDPGDYGIYKFKALDFQRMVETTELDELILRIVNRDIPSSKPLFVELLNNPLKMESHPKKKFNESGDCERMELDDFEAKELDGSDIYIHIPRYLKELVRSEERTDDMKIKLEEALTNHVNYNFKID